jgi:hypothetical protein
VVQDKQEMEQAALLWAGLLVGLAAVGQVEILPVQVLLVILRRPHLLRIQMQAKEILGVTGLQMELLVLVVEVVVRVLLEVQQVVQAPEEPVEMAAQELRLLFQVRL